MIKYISTCRINSDTVLFGIERAFEKFHAGLGAVKMAVSGLREQRFDFVGFPGRQFHPIGKLSSLQFRLEKTDGTLYDSKLIEHTLLLVIRYYSVVASSQKNDKMLNPGYTPDVQQYLVDTKWRAESEQDDFYK